MQDDEFEWDDQKAARNLAKHKLSFYDARLAFDDGQIVDDIDLSEVYDEDRRIAIGLVKGRLVHISYTFRQNRIRIISARGAKPFEQRRYYEGK
jgi:uncharacterized protein